MKKQSNTVAKVSCLPQKTFPQAVQSLKDYPSSLVSREILDLAYAKQVIYPKDYGFYVSLFNRKAAQLSMKQQSWVNDINQRIFKVFQN